MRNNAHSHALFGKSQQVLPASPTCPFVPIVYHKSACSWVSAKSRTKTPRPGIPRTGRGGQSVSPRPLPVIEQPVSRPPTEPARNGQTAFSTALAIPRQSMRANHSFTRHLPQASISFAVFTAVITAPPSTPPCSLSVSVSSVPAGTSSSAAGHARRMCA